ncbi:glycosyltransferase [bacterium]|nr:glycosyltransferase [bacterium]
MKLLLITPELMAGGAERDMINLCRGLTRRGHSVTLACHAGELSPEAEASGARIVELPAHARTPAGLKRFGAGLKKLVEKLQPEVVHSQAILPALAARRVLGRTLPSLVTIHNLRYRIYYPLAAHLLNRAADRVLFVSDYEGRRFRNWGFPQRKSRTLHTGLPEAFFEKQPAESHEHFRYLFAARITGEKGHAELLTALAEAGELNFRLWIAGDGLHREQVEQLSQRLGLDDTVRFLGFRRDVRQLMARCDALVLPSQRESLPLSLREGFAQGLPAVATAVGGIPELIEHEVNGLLISPGNLATFARSMIRFASRPAIARRMGIAARQMALERWTQPRYLDALERHYRELIENN